MVISAYQVNNVLRVYRDQLRHGRMSGRQSNIAPHSPDRISISAGGKQKAMMDKISSGIAEKINRYGTPEETGKEASAEPGNGFGIQPDSDQNVTGGLVYKMVDDQGERINVFTLGDIKNSESFGI
jgi:hypothetical protein